MPSARRRLRRGFTLIEAALTTVIVGTGVLAIVAAQQAYHMKNDWSQRTATGMLLANEIRELTLPMPRHDPISGAGSLGPEVNEHASPDWDDGKADWDDLDDFAGKVDPVFGFQDRSDPTKYTFLPPINSLRQKINDLPGWRQEVLVAAVPPDDPDYDWVAAAGPQYALDAPDTLIRITVNVWYQSPHEPQESNVATLTWLVARQLSGY